MPPASLTFRFIARMAGNNAKDDDLPFATVRVVLADPNVATTCEDNAITRFSPEQNEMDDLHRGQVFEA
jgi:hypothetical protein